MGFFDGGDQKRHIEHRTKKLEIMYQAQEGDVPRAFRVSKRSPQLFVERNRNHIPVSFVA